MELLVSCFIFLYPATVHSISNQKQRNLIQENFQLQGFYSLALDELLLSGSILLIFRLRTRLKFVRICNWRVTSDSVWHGTTAAKYMTFPRVPRRHHASLVSFADCMSIRMHFWHEPKLYTLCTGTLQGIWKLKLNSRHWDN